MSFDNFDPSAHWQELVSGDHTYNAFLYRPDKESHVIVTIV